MNKRKITSKKRVKRDMQFYIKQTFRSKYGKRLKFYLRKLYRSFGVKNVY